MKSTALLCLLSGLVLLVGPVVCDDEAGPLEAALEFERQRLAAIARVEPAVCCVFSPDGQGGGSGVLISPDGYALSNFHVTQANREMPVGLPDGKRYQARLIAIDPTGDIALIRLVAPEAGFEFPFAPLGDSNECAVGDKAIAMGNPFLLAKDFKPTITLGNITGLHRHLPGSGNFNLVYSDCIQIDTPINPGNSGGPLFNLRGELIGINGRMTVRDRGRVNTGIGFAISINQIKNFLPALRHGDQVEHALIDATVRRNPDGRIIFDMMFDDSPAHRAGVRIGDELVRFDGVEIDTVNRFANLIYTLPAGKEVEIVFRREGETKSARCVLRGIPSGSDDPNFEWPGPPEGHLDWELSRMRALGLAAAGQTPEGEWTASGTLGDDPVRIEYDGLTPRTMTVGPTTYRFERFSVVTGDEEVAPADARRLRELARIGRAAEFAAPGDAFDRVRFTGDGWHEQTPCLVVEARRESGLTERYLIGERDHRIRRIEFIEPGDRHVATLELAGYRKAGHAILPAHIRWVAGDSTTELRLASWQTGSDAPTEGTFDALVAPVVAPVPNPYQALLDPVWPSVLKVYGQGHIRGIPAQGTAVVVDADKGLALTNLTIMLETPSLYVVDHLGNEWKAKVVKRDRDRLLALIELQAQVGREFPPALAPASSAGIGSGDLILSIGNAEDLAAGRELPSANLGVVTARTILRARAGIQDFPYDGEVLINDAKVNPGAYGGPVLDMAGRWIGINAKIVESKATNTQVSYTVPIDAIIDFLPGHDAAVVPDPVDRRPVYHGIRLFDENPMRSPPAFIDRVDAGSPAAAARLRSDDLILRADGIRIRTCADLEAFFATCRPEQEVVLSVKRKDKIIQKKLVLEAAEEDE